MTETPVAAEGHRVPEHLAALTSLRFFAAMYVLLFHYSLAYPTLYSGLVGIGYTGVTFFFILSGFILAHTYYGVDFKQRSDLHRYFAARLSRIYPIYILSLLVSVPFAVGIISRTQAGILTALAASSGLLAPLGLQAWLPGAACTINCPSWSISAEFFFYMLFPLFVRPVMINPWRWLTFILGFWALVCSGYSWMWDIIAPGGSLVSGHENSGQALTAEMIKFFPVGRLPEFLLGIVLYAIWKHHRARFSPELPIFAFVVGAIAIVMLADFMPVVFLHNGLTAVVWVPLILGAASMRTGPLCSPVAVFLGRISFALYLFHLPVLFVCKALDKRLFNGQIELYPESAIVAMTLLAMITAALVFILVEEPLRRRLPRMLLRTGVFQTATARADGSDR